MSTLCNTSHFPNVLKCLKDHLQAICAVEYYTIPLYLSATYSFSIAAMNSSVQYTPTDACGGSPGQQPLFWWLQQKTLSVAVQEMYHLQCASNIANAIDFHPSLDPAIFDWAGPVPHLPNVKGIGFDNLEKVLDVLIGIETPADGPFPPPNEQVEYDSISALYHATLTLLDLVMAHEGQLQFESAANTALPPGEWGDQMDYQTFATRYKYTVVKSRNDIAQLANAISWQGEGAGVVKNFHIKFPHLAQVLRQGENLKDGDIPVQYQSAAGSRFARFDCVSHYERFKQLKEMITGNVEYSQAAQSLPAGRRVFNSIGKPDPDRPSWVADAAALKNCLNLAYSYLLDVINQGMIKGGGLDPSKPSNFTFTSVMTAFKYLLPQLWQWGDVPDYHYEAGVTDEQLQAAFDKADPLCLYHWDAATIALRKDQPKDLNVCQGLNTCKGLGWGALGAKAGDGACATADLHTCSGGNACANMGGCGFTVSGVPCLELWAPGANECKAHGGCQVPISPLQVFSGSLPSDCTTNPAKAGDNVWKMARQLLATKQGGTLPSPQAPVEKDGVDYDGAKRRASLTPTST